MLISKTDKDKNKRLYGDEMVYCLPSNAIDFIDKEFWTYDKRFNNIWTIFDDKGKYMFRYEIEGTSIVHQLIPYIVVFNTKGELLCHTHKKSGKISLGYSQHMTPENSGTGKDKLLKVCIDLVVEHNLPFFGASLMFQGYIKTFKGSNIGHLGAVFQTIMDDDVSVPKETEEFTYEFKSIKDIMDSYGKLETWAKLTLNHYFESKGE